ncbi:MAG TPA: type II and III secretion system protein family protein [Micropepsaceae bacterium]|nr:type II and III secretion system protein family protein [Micropepsaceae bacterium]
MSPQKLKILLPLRQTVAALAFVLGVASGPALAQPVQPATDSRIIHIAATPGAMPQHLPLALNKAVILELDTDARDVFVGNPAIADAVVRTPRRIFIMALKLGKTNAIFLDPQGKQIATIEIDVGTDVADLNDQLAKQLPGSKVKAEALNDNVVLGGTANTVREAQIAQDLANRFTGNKPDTVVNGLKIGQSSQVLIKVRVSEMNRTIAKQFGVNVAAAIGKDATGAPLVVGSTDNQFSLLGRALADLSGANFGPACFGNPACVDKAAATLQALERVGLVHTLAEPNLTAVSGEAAKFLAGGEFPVPTGRDLQGNITITFKQFGVGLAFTPVVLDKGHISLQVSTEVSELTNTGAFILQGISTTGGLTIPALAVRRAETTVELPSGGTMMIGGLLQQQNKQNLDGFPGLKDLPVLGALFRSRDFQNNESELVVTVTAYLVDPIADQKLARPDDGFVVPTDFETIFFGRLNAVYGKAAVLPPNVPKNAVGYIVQ